jgi:hypothetical protein
MHVGRDGAPSMFDACPSYAAAESDFGSLALRNADRAIFWVAF